MFESLKTSWVTLIVAGPGSSLKAKSSASVSLPPSLKASVSWPEGSS